MATTPGHKFTGSSSSHSLLSPFKHDFHSTNTALVRVPNLHVAKCSGHFSVLTLLDVPAALPRLICLCSQGLHLTPRTWVFSHLTACFLLICWLLLPELLTLGCLKVQSLDHFPFPSMFMFLVIPILLAFNTTYLQTKSRFSLSSQIHKSNHLLNISFRCLTDISNLTFPDWTDLSP